MNYVNVYNMLLGNLYNMRFFNCTIIVNHKKNYKIKRPILKSSRYIIFIGF